MIFDLDFFLILIDLFMGGIATGFVLGFIAWGVGFGIYSVIKWIKMA